MCACDRTQDLIGVVPKCLKAELYKTPLQAFAFPTVFKIPPFLDSYKIYYRAKLQASQKGQRASILHSQITRYHQAVPRACLERCTAVSLATSQPALTAVLSRSAPTAMPRGRQFLTLIMALRKYSFFFYF